MMQKRVTPEGCLGLFRRQVYLDVALRGKEVTCYETVEGLEVRGLRHRVYLLREYRRWQNRYWWNGGRSSRRTYALSRIRPRCVRGLLSHNDSDPLQEIGLWGAVLVGGGSDRRFALTRSLIGTLMRFYGS